MSFHILHFTVYACYFFPTLFIHENIILYLFSLAYINCFLSLKLLGLLLNVVLLSQVLIASLFSRWGTTPNVRFAQSSKLELLFFTFKQHWDVRILKSPLSQTLPWLFLCFRLLMCFFGFVSH
jgi:hypothetical protein